MSEELTVLVEAFEKIAPLVQQLFEDPISISITDKEKVLRIINHPRIPLGIEPGMILKKEEPMYQAIYQNKFITVVVPKEIFGFQFRAVGIPLKDKNGNVIGGMGLGTNLERQEEVARISNNLSNSLNELATAISQVTQGVQEIADYSKESLTRIDQTKEETKNTDGVINFIRAVAGQTNLLGLNAAIEAARAGEHGRGFSVVAEEIRKLSASSTESIKQIEGTIKNINNHVTNVSNGITKENGILQEQAAALEQINASIEELNATAHLLADIAQKM